MSNLFSRKRSGLFTSHILPRREREPNLAEHRPQIVDALDPSMTDKLEEPPKYTASARLLKVQLDEPDDSTHVIPFPKSYDELADTSRRLLHLYGLQPLNISAILPQFGPQWTIIEPDAWDSLSNQVTSVRVTPRAWPVRVRVKGHGDITVFCAPTTLMRSVKELLSERVGIHLDELMLGTDRNGLSDRQTLQQLKYDVKNPISYLIAQRKSEYTPRA